ncbi:MAG: single-stranded DNA-binding protein [Bdellovibrionales bacterium]
MKSMNRVFLMGHLGRKPELTWSKAGRPYTRLSVATHRRWTHPDEGVKETTEWHSVFVWGALAETCCKHLDKGALVFVEGALTYWKVAEPTPGETPYKNAVHAEEVRFLHLSIPARTGENPALSEDMENLDNPMPSRNHNAVAHPA